MSQQAEGSADFCGLLVDAEVQFQQDYDARLGDDPNLRDPAVAEAWLEVTHERMRDTVVVLDELRSVAAADLASDVAIVRDNFQAQLDVLDSQVEPNRRLLDTSRAFSAAQDSYAALETYAQAECGVAGFFYYGFETGAYGPVAVIGAAFPPYTGQDADPAVGTVTPEIVASNLDGAVELVEHDGVARVLVFMPHWCPHCQAQLPLLQSWLNGGGLQPGAEIVMVSTSLEPEAPNWPPEEWFAREGWTQRVLRDDADNTILQSFGGAGVGFPYWVFIDEAGLVTLRSIGELDTNTLASYVSQMTGR